MSTLIDIKNEAWWQTLDESQRELLQESLLLLVREERLKTNWHDYAFVVFPAAKAYEGFLKKLFLDLGFISQQQYEGDRFRIGRALNPSLEAELRWESIYDRLTDRRGGDELPEYLWQTWKRSRNLLFHWFPWHKNAISLTEARGRIEMIIEAMRAANLAFFATSDPIMLTPEEQLPAASKMQNGNSMTPEKEDE
ncbi:MAG: hypothetical protein UW69_C0079G0009 [Microgenomates group bacterium GW2011_GWA2_44_7]|nr:MAG: hypothetical protein UW69_C0079G0009 [Microgenomates group bacterium GW2011_GWA2_44_7]